MIKGFKGPFINSVTRDRPLFRPEFTHHLRHATFRPFSEYFEPASRSIFDLDLPPPVTRDGIYDRPLMEQHKSFFLLS